MKIEKSVPIPHPPRGRRPEYPFAEMEVGDSILVEGQDTTGPAYNAAKGLQYSQKNRVRFTARTVEGGIRIWRVE